MVAPGQVVVRTPLRIEISVPADAAGVRLDLFLTEYVADSFEAELPQLSRSRIQKLAKGGNILVDGEPSRCATRLRGAERVSLTLPEPVPSTVVPEAIPLSVLYEDGDLIVIDKPAGLVVHPGAGHPAGTLVNALLAHCHDLSGIGGALRPGIVHRLDAGTSGVMVVAKNDHAHAELARQFAERTVDKRYIAFVVGSPTPARGLLDTHYGRHPKHRTRFSSRVTSGRRATTRYEVVAAAGGLARLDVELGTGRTHQIRVHFADIAHPVVGDPLYGGTGDRVRRLPAGEIRDCAAALARQALHAARLALDHPRGGGRMVFRAPLPADLAAVAGAIEAAR